MVTCTITPCRAAVRLNSGVRPRVQDLSRSIEGALSVIVALGGTICSSWLPRKTPVTHPSIMGCENGCDVSAGGWPFIYVVDGMTSSPVGSADFLGALVGLDDIRWEMFALNFVVWLSAIAIVAFAFSKRR